MSNNKLKIGFFIPYFAPAWRFGGELRGTYELGKSLAKLGHQIRIYCTDVSNSKGKRHDESFKIIDGMDVYYFKNLSNQLASKFKIFLPIKMKKFVSQAIQKLDIIHLQNLYSIITFMVYHEVKKKNKPLFISTRGTLSSFSQRSFKTPKKILNIYMRKVLKRADLVFAQTKDEKLDCLKFGLKNVRVISNGIEKKIFENLPSGIKFREKYNINHDELIILYLGRISRVKGIEYLIKSFSNLKNKKSYNIKLVVIGPDDNYLKNLKGLMDKSDCKKDIIFINGLYGKEKIEALSSADIFCLPSLYDCCPNSLLEACASGLPVITTDRNGLSDLIKEDLGLVVPAGNTAQLEAALQFLIENPKIRKKYGNLARKKIMNEYSWKRVSQKLEKYYLKSYEKYMR